MIVLFWQVEVLEFFSEKLSQAGMQEGYGGKLILFQGKKKEKKIRLASQKFDETDFLQEIFRDIW